MTALFLLSLATIASYASAQCSSIAEIACSTDAFSTLCAAVTQAGLQGILSEGSFTVFAPSNDAFANLGSEMLDAVLADNELLTDILLYHVVDDIVFSTDLECNDKVKMANGKKTRTVCVDESIFQAGKGNTWEAMPQIIEMDIEACNGLIHVVDQVILPDMEDMMIDVEAENMMPEMGDEEEAMMPEMGKAKEEMMPEMGDEEAVMPEMGKEKDEMMPEMGEEEMMPEMGAADESAPAGCSTIAEIACSMDDFSTLCAAVTQAGLQGILSEGSFTVFAPSNDAFANLGSEMLDAVLADNELLTDILLYHVVDDSVFSTDLECNDKVKMANGKKTRTVCVDESIFQAGKGNTWEAMPQIIEMDIEACNGLIHVVDQVILPDMEDMMIDVEAENMMPEMGDEEEAMMPEMGKAKEEMMPEMGDEEAVMPEMGKEKDEMMPEMGEEEMMPEMGAADESAPAGCSTIAEIACSMDDFSTLCAAVTQAGLQGILSEGSFTVFAPSNDAFANLGSEMLDAVLADNELLTDILLYHVVDDSVFSTDLECNDKVKMANGKKTRTVCVDESIFQVGKGNTWEAMPQIIEMDIEACNGLIHVVDQVILPDMEDMTIDMEAENMMPEMGDEEEAMMPEMGKAKEEMMPEMGDEEAVMPEMGKEKDEMMPEMGEEEMMPEMGKEEAMTPEMGAADESAPAGCSTIAEIACSMDDFSTLCAAVTQAGLQGILSEGSFTVFAPSNDAFANLGSGMLDAVLADNELLTDILLYHVVDDSVFSTDLECNDKVKMANGKKTRTVCVDESIFQMGKGNTWEAMPQIIDMDIEACNGLIHVVDQVILPKLK